MLADESTGQKISFFNRSELEPVRQSEAHAGYDRILMNPTFSECRDAQYVMRAYDMLKLGGRLVAILGEGVFFGGDKKATQFRE